MSGGTGQRGRGVLPHPSPKVKKRREQSIGHVVIDTTTPEFKKIYRDFLNSVRR